MAADDPVAADPAAEGPSVGPPADHPVDQPVDHVYVDDLVTSSRTGSRRATARLLSIVERGGDAADLVAAATHPHVGTAHVVGMTGAPGSGKSTITGVLTTLLAGTGRCPAVLAVDPSSPLTGGAILGDRIRMGDAAASGVFIRSMATRGHAGGLALAVPGAVRVLVAAGYDPVFIETVGVGQVEVDVTAAADTTVVVVAPGWGDAVQANKAGLLEIADLFVVNKADRPGAADARRDLELMIDLSVITGRVGSVRPAVLMTTATESEGIEALAGAIDDHFRLLAGGSGLALCRERRRLAEVAAHLDHLLALAAEGVLADDPGSPSTGLELPTATARRLADRLLRGVSGAVTEGTDRPGTQGQANRDRRTGIGEQGQANWNRRTGTGAGEQPRGTAAAHADRLAPHGFQTPRPPGAPVA